MPRMATAGFPRTLQRKRIRGGPAISEQHGSTGRPTAPPESAAASHATVAAGENDLVARDLRAALDAYTALLDDLEARRIDETTFRRKAIEVAVVSTPEGVWLLDAVAGGWVLYDGVGFRGMKTKQSPPPPDPKRRRRSRAKPRKR